MFTAHAAAGALWSLFFLVCSKALVEVWALVPGWHGLIADVDRVEPALAERWTISPDGLTYMFHLRRGVTFHDGTHLTAADVVASMSRILDPAVGSSWYSVYQNVVSIEQTGDLQVTVTMNGPDSQFNLGMGGSAGVIESAATLAEKGADYGNSTGGVNCTGPFSFKEWKSGESVTLERYDDYWDPELKARSGEVKFLFMNDANARVNALKSGFSRISDSQTLARTWLSA